MVKLLKSRSQIEKKLNIEPKYKNIVKNQRKLVKKLTEIHMRKIMKIDQ